MKRLLPAAILSFTLHALVFSMDTGRFKTGLYPKLIKEPLTLSLAYRPLAGPHLPPAAKPINAENPQPAPPPAPKTEPKPPPAPVVEKSEATAPEKEKPAEKLPEALPEEQAPALEKYFSVESDAPVQPEVSNAPAPATAEFNAAPAPGKASQPAPTEPLPKSFEKAAPEKSSSTRAATVRPQPVPTPTQAGEVIRQALPLYKENPVPGYPRRARKRGYQGTVILNVFVTQNGVPAEIRLLTSSRYSILDRAAMAAVKEWRFEPGRRNDEKVDMWIRVPIRFQLK